MKNIIVMAFLFLVVESATASCYQAALSAASEAQIKYDFDSSQRYDGDHFSENETEMASYLKFVGYCRGADPTLITVKVSFSNLSACSHPTAEVVSCVYMP